MEKNLTEEAMLREDPYRVSKSVLGWAKRWTQGKGGSRGSRRQRWRRQTHGDRDGGSSHGTRYVVSAVLDPASRMVYEARTGTRRRGREEAGTSLRGMCVRFGAQ